MSTDSRIPWGSPRFQVILLSSLMGVMGVSLISPALPTVRTGLGITDGEAALLITAFTVPGIVLAPAIGVLTDRYGRRAVLVPCLLVYSVTGVGVVFTTNFHAILLLRILQGTVGSVLVTLAITLIGDLYQGSQRTHLMGVNGAVLSAGTAFYPFIGGALANVSWRAPFALYAVGLPVGLLALRSLDGRGGTSHGLDYVRNLLGAIPMMRTLGVYGAYVVAFVVLYGGLITAVPFLLTNQYGVGSVTVGSVLTGSSAVTAITAGYSGRLGSHMTTTRLVGFGVVGYGVGLVGAGLASTPLEVALTILFIGGGQGIVQPSLDTLLSSLVSTEFRGGVMSLRTTAIRIGQTLGPVLATGIGALYGYDVFLLIAGTGALLGGGTVALTLD